VLSVCMQRHHVVRQMKREQSATLPRQMSSPFLWAVLVTAVHVCCRCVSPGM
jgi:hypothetical protein